MSSHAFPFEFCQLIHERLQSFSVCFDSVQLHGKRTALEAQRRSTALLTKVPLLHQPCASDTAHSSTPASSEQFFNFVPSQPMLGEKTLRECIAMCAEP